MQSKRFKSLISCFLNIQTPFCGQKLAFPTELKGEFAFYRILFSKQAVQVLHTYVSRTEQAREHFGALWDGEPAWLGLIFMTGWKVLDTTVIFSLLFTKAEKNLTRFEPCHWFSALETTHKPF